MTARSTAQADAVTIRDETTPAANTHTRVGAAIKELADNTVFAEDAGAVGDIADLGVKAAGAAGKFANAAHVHTLPRLDQVAAPTAPVSFNAQEATSLAAPTAQTSAARVLELDARLVVVDLVYTSALPAYTYNNGTAGAGATISLNSNVALPAADATPVAVGMKVLINVGAASSDNCIYDVTTLGNGTSVGGVLTRSTCADTPAKIAGLKVRVKGGLQCAGAEYAITNPAAITIGTTPIFALRQLTADFSNEVVKLCDTDFVWGTGPAVNTVGPEGLVNGSTGAGAGVTAAAAGSQNAARIGVLSVSTGTTTTGHGRMFHSPAVFQLSTDVGFVIDFKGGVPTLSDGTNTYSAFVGFSDTLALAQVNCIGLLYDQPNSSNWQLYTSVASTPVKAASGSSIVAATDEHFRLVKNPGETGMAWYRNGVLIGTAASLPTAQIYLTFWILKSLGGTARVLELDWLTAILYTPKRRIA